MGNRPQNRLIGGLEIGRNCVRTRDPHQNERTTGKKEGAVPEIRTKQLIGAAKEIEHRHNIQPLPEPTERGTNILQIFSIIDPQILCFLTAFQPTVFVHTSQM